MGDGFWWEICMRGRRGGNLYGGQRLGALFTMESDCAQESLAV